MKYSFFIILIFLFAGCNLTDSDNSSLTEKVIVENNIEYSLSIPKNNFLINDTLNISFTVKNNSLSAKEFYFANIQQLGFQIINTAGDVSLYHPVVVSPATSKIVLSPSERKELSAISLFKDLSGNYIDRGKYLLSAYLLDNNTPKLNLEIAIH